MLGIVGATEFEGFLMVFSGGYFAVWVMTDKRITTTVPLLYNRTVVYLVTGTNSNLVLPHLVVVFVETDTGCTSSG